MTNIIVADPSSGSSPANNGSGAVNFNQLSHNTAVELRDGNEQLKRNAAVLARDARKAHRDPQTVARDNALIEEDREIIARANVAVTNFVHTAVAVLSSGPSSPSGNVPKGTNSLYSDISTVLAIIDDFLHTLNGLQLTNAAAMQQMSQEEVGQNQAFENAENFAGTIGTWTPIANGQFDNYMWLLKNDPDDSPKWSAAYQDDNSKNQAIIKQIDSVYQQWQSAVNQSNQNQQPILAVGSAITQFIANFLRYIHT